MSQEIHTNTFTPFVAPPTVLSRQQPERRKFVILASHIQDEEPHVTVFVRYNADISRYDSGILLVLEFSQNTEVIDALENRIIHRRSNLSSEFIEGSLLSALTEGEVEAHFSVETRKGIGLLVHKKAVPISYPLLDIDERTNKVPCVDISMLTKVRQIHPTVDLVVLRDDTNLYAFKHFGDVPYDRDQPVQYELLVLSCLTSRFIISPRFIVTNCSRKYFRGYLTTFHPEGSLRAVLASLHPEDSYLNIDQIASARSQLHKPHPLRLGWEVKLSWASNIAHGVRDLHGQRVYSGDIKLDNILLKHNGDVVLIDVAYTGTTSEYCPPEFELEAMGTGTPTHDIFSLGLVLWSLAEEVPTFLRASNSKSLNLPWSDSIPTWYKDLVAGCLHLNKSQRPTADSILFEIQRHVVSP